MSNFHDIERKFELRSPVTPYVCSTPDDFEEERDWLEEYAFPELVKLCCARGTYFSPTDVRWSAEDTVTQDGHLLPCLLESVARSAPYFLCLLGERYGPYQDGAQPAVDKLVHDQSSDHGETKDWMDLNLTLAAQSGHQWVMQDSHQNCSIPELEVIAATFRGHSNQCTFYFRQAEHLDTKLKGLTKQEAAELSTKFLPESDHAGLKIQSLKQTIVKRGLPVRYFKTPQELVQIVLEDWTAILDTVCPPLADNGQFLDTAHYQQWLAREGLLTRLRSDFVQSEATDSVEESLSRFVLTAIDEQPQATEETPQETSANDFRSAISMFRQKPAPPSPFQTILLLNGDRGSGKSVLLAHWLQEFAEENPGIFLIHHFIGAETGDNDIAAFLRRCTRDLRKHFLLTEVTGHAELDDSSSWWSEEDVETPSDFHMLCQAFVAALALGPSILVLDGINDLSATAGFSQQEVKEFDWLPTSLPRHCRIVLSTSRADLTYRSLCNRGDVKVVNLPGVKDKVLKMAYLKTTLKPHVLPFVESRQKMISDMRLLTSPLSLCVLSMELNRPSVHRHVEEFVDQHFETTSLRAFWTYCLQEWVTQSSWTRDDQVSVASKDDGLFDYTGWVADALCLLIVSRGGLRQDELLQVLRRMGYVGSLEVTVLHWLQLRLRAGNLLWETADGRIRFSHQHIQDVTEYTLLRAVSSSSVDVTTANEAPHHSSKRKVHMQLATFFAIQPLSWRQAQELPWHLLMAGDLQQLLSYVTHSRVVELYLAKCSQYPDAHQDLYYYWTILEKQGHKAGTNYLRLLREVGLYTLPPAAELSDQLPSQTNVQSWLQGHPDIIINEDREDDEMDQDARSVSSSKISISPEAKVGENIVWKEKQTFEIGKTLVTRPPSGRRLGGAHQEFGESHSAFQISKKQTQSVRVPDFEGLGSAVQIRQKKTSFMTQNDTTSGQIFAGLEDTLQVPGKMISRESTNQLAVSEGTGQIRRKKSSGTRPQELAVPGGRQKKISVLDWAESRIFPSKLSLPHVKTAWSQKESDTATGVHAEELHSTSSADRLNARPISSPASYRLSLKPVAEKEAFVEEPTSKPRSRRQSGRTVSSAECKSGLSAFRQRSASSSPVRWEPAQLKSTSALKRRSTAASSLRPESAKPNQQPKIVTPRPMSAGVKPRGAGVDVEILASKKIFRLASATQARQSVLQPQKQSIPAIMRFLLTDSFTYLHIPHLLEGMEADRQKEVVAELSWAVGRFLLEMGQSQDTQVVFSALQSFLQASYPLPLSTQLMLVRLLERLGTLSYHSGDYDSANVHYHHALRVTFDLDAMEEDLCDHRQVDTFKGVLLGHHGDLRLREGDVLEGGELLKEGTESISHLTGNHVLRAALLFQLGVFRGQLGEVTRAEASFRQCLALRQQWHGKVHPEVATVLLALARVVNIVSTYKHSDHRKEVEALYRKALTVSERCLGTTHPQVADILTELGELVAEEEGRIAKMEARRLLQRSLDIRTTALGADDSSTKAARNSVRRVELSLQLDQTDMPSARPDHIALMPQRDMRLPYMGSRAGLGSRGGVTPTRAEFGGLDIRSVSREKVLLHNRPDSIMSSAYSMMSASERLLASRPRSSKSKGSRITSATSSAVGGRTATSMSVEWSAKAAPVEVRLDLDEEIVERPDDEEGGELGADLAGTSTPRRERSPGLGMDKPHPRTVVLDLDLTTEDDGPPQEMVEAAGEDADGQDTPHLDTFAVHLQDGTIIIGEEPRSKPKKRVKVRPHSTPHRLFHHYASIASGDGAERSCAISCQPPRPRSQRSGGYGRRSWSARTTGSSVGSHVTRCSVPGPHDIPVSNDAHSLNGPHADIGSLLGPPACPRDNVYPEVHHRSAFYHVPGRYPTATKSYPSRRSQKTEGARILESVMTVKLSQASRQQALLWATSPSSAAPPAIGVNQRDVTMFVQKTGINRSDSRAAAILSSARASPPAETVKTFTSPAVKFREPITVS